MKMQLSSRIRTAVVMLVGLGFLGTTTASVVTTTPAAATTTSSNSSIDETSTTVDKDSTSDHHYYVRGSRLSSLSSSINDKEVSLEAPASYHHHRRFLNDHLVTGTEQPPPQPHTWIDPTSSRVSNNDGEDSVVVVRRSPHAGLNALANHGYINYNGTDIEMTELSHQYADVYGVSTDFVWVTIVVPALHCGAATTTGTSTGSHRNPKEDENDSDKEDRDTTTVSVRLNLDALYKPECHDFHSIFVTNSINHSHHNVNSNINSTLNTVNTTLVTELLRLEDGDRTSSGTSASNGIRLTLDDLAVFQYNRIFEEYYEYYSSYDDNQSNNTNHEEPTSSIDNDNESKDNNYNANDNRNATGKVAIVPGSKYMAIELLSLALIARNDDDDDDADAEEGMMTMTMQTPMEDDANGTTSSTASAKQNVLSTITINTDRLTEFLLYERLPESFLLQKKKNNNSATRPHAEGDNEEPLPSPDPPRAPPSNFLLAQDAMYPVFLECTYSTI